jgi:hypothetical protein
MGRKIILWVLGYAWLALLAGVGLIGMAAYSAYSAGHGGGMPEAADLSAAKGTVVGGREMTVERKRRRGGKTTTHFFELDLQPDAGGELVKLRVDYAIDRAKLQAAMDQKVSASYDASDHNMVYEILGDKGPIVSKDDMAKILVAKAEADKATFASGGMLGFAVLLALLGGGGLVWRRKLLAQG